MMNMFTKYFTSIVYVICSVILIVQICWISSAYIWPVGLNTIVTKEELKSSKFPALMRVRVFPGLDTDQEILAGYEWYFVGMSRFNSSVFGWTGHSKEGNTNMTAKGKENSIFMQSF